MPDRPTPAAGPTHRADPAEARAARASGRSTWWTLVAVCTGVFMLLLDITIVNVALPDIQNELDASLSDLQWVIDAYALSLAALLLTAGSLADLYGRRKVFVIGLVLFTVGSTACGLAQDVLLLTLSRAFQGIGGAAMFATALALLAGAYTGRERGIAFGVFGATTGVAVAIGPVLGGVLTTGLSWRWIFWVNIPISLVAIAVTLLRVAESQNPRAGRPDWVGFVVFSGALGALVYGLIEAGQGSWGDTVVLACLVAFVVLLGIFVVTQLRGRDPMFDLSLLRKPTFTGGLIAAFGVSASIFSVLAYLVIYLQNVLGYSAVGTGVRLLFLSAASFLAAAIAGRLTEKLPVKWLIGPGFALVAGGLALMLGIQDDSTWTHLVPGLIVAGVGIGLINPPLASTAVGVVEVARAGMASGINSTLRQVGIATGIAALGSLFSQQVSSAVTSRLQGEVPAGAVEPLAAALSGGQVQRAAEVAGAQATQAGGAQAGSRAQQVVESIGTSAVVDALNHILLIAALLALVAGIASFVLIRQSDFVDPSGPSQGSADATPDQPDARPDDRSDAQPDTQPDAEPDAEPGRGEPARA